MKKKQDSLIKHAKLYCTNDRFKNLENFALNIMFTKNMICMPTITLLIE